MEQFDAQFWIQMCVYMGTFGAMYGTVKTEIKYLKEKLDKHNSFQDRLVKAEESGKSIHHRLDEIKDHIKECPTRR